MNGDTHLSIGELARLTGLTVRTVRSYSDRGIVPPDGRTAAGHRRYGPDAVARLQLVRTLRELGLDRTGPAWGTGGRLGSAAPVAAVCLIPVIPWDSLPLCSRSVRGLVSAWPYRRIRRRDGGPDPGRRSA